MKNQELKIKKKESGKPKASKAVKASQKISNKKSPQPKTMEDLLAQTGYQIKGLRKGQEVDGVITSIGKKKILIDIGAKTEGVVLEKEYENAKDMVSKLKEGDKIKIIVGMPESEKGQILLSLRRAAENYKWETLQKQLENEDEIEVRGLDVNKGGMISRVMDIYGFVPVSQFGRKWLGNLDKLYNKLFKVKIIEVDRDKNRLIFSEKAVSEAGALAAQGKALKRVKAGDELKGIISGIMPFGVFVRVDIGNTETPAPADEGKTKKKTESIEKSKAEKVSPKDVEDAEKKDKKKGIDLFLEGLVHISEISWEKVEDLNRIYKVGDKVNVKVLGVDKKSSRLNLSIKQLQSDPWKLIAGKYKIDKKFKGKVVKLAAFGAFVQLEKNLQGLVHISKIPADYDIQLEDDVDVYVENVDVNHRRIALGLVLVKKPVGYK